MAETTQNSAVDYDAIMDAFTKSSNKVFLNNVTDYTVNDKNFIHGLAQMFGNAMAQKGLNVLDPIYANFFHYNKMNMLGNVDFPRVSRTYVFFSRPELNFSLENLQAVPFFRWLFSKPIGKMIMCSLTDPEYFIGGPAALSNYTTVGGDRLNTGQILYIIEKYQKEINDLSKQYNTLNNGFPSNKFKSVYNSAENDASSVFDFNNLDGDVASALADLIKPPEGNAESDDPAEVARLQGLDFSGLYDEATFSSLTANFKNANELFSRFMTDYETYVKNNCSQLYAAMGVTTGSELYKALADKNLHQAKNLLRDTHDSAFDKFNFTSPFIPLLGNTCTQVTGAKDFQLNEHTYEEDEFSATIKVPTGMDELWGPGTLSTQFTDMAYGPVSLMMMVWVLYIHYVSRGTIATTREHVLERILDYTCSIYVFVIGDDGRRIERWGKYTGCYPTSFPMSSQLEHNTNVETDMLQKVQISWTYNRYEPMDPQVFTDFNFLSESEWLVKLKKPYWEYQYDRDSSLNKLNQFMIDIDSTNGNYDEKYKLDSIKRPHELWETISNADRGMSGKLPMALIEPMPRTKDSRFKLKGNGDATFPQQTPEWRKHSEWYIDAMNNYWGGYPYITNGGDFVWVLPQWTEQNGVYKDTGPTKDTDGKNGYLQSKNKTTAFNNNNYHGDATKFSEHNTDSYVHTSKVQSGPLAGFFIGNGTLQTANQGSANNSGDTRG